MRRLVPLIAALALLLAVPGAALAQGNPFSPPPINPNPTPAAPTPTSTATPGGGLSSTGTTTLYVIGAALLVAFVGIGVWIARDARRALPESRRGEPATADGPSRRRSPQVKQRARARTRAQRRARRHNR
jgi:hypothetical protein